MAKRGINGKWLSSEPTVGPGVSIAGLATIVAVLPLLLLVGALGSAPASVDTLASVDAVAAPLLPDTDRDGISDTRDTDDDNDGVADKNDAFPLDKKESKDIDGDKVGNNGDPDKDGDGYLNKYDPFPLGVSGRPDFDNDGTEDTKDIDIDGDGIKNAAEKGGATGTYAYDGNNDGKHDRLQRALNEKFDTDGNGESDVKGMVRLAKQLANDKYGMTFTGPVNDFSSFPPAFFARATAGDLGACVTSTRDRDGDGLWDGITDKNRYVAHGGSGGDYFTKYERNYPLFAVKAKEFGLALGAPPDAARSAADAAFIGNFTQYQLPPSYLSNSGYGIYTAQNAVPEFRSATAEHAFYEALYSTGKPPTTFQGHWEVYASSGSVGAPVVYNPAQFTQQHGYTTDYGQVTSSGGYTTTGGGTYDPGAGTYTHPDGTTSSGSGTTSTSGGTTYYGTGPVPPHSEYVAPPPTYVAPPPTTEVAPPPTTEVAPAPAPPPIH